jgi:DNA-binding transcriptional regulator PaaX
MRGDGILTILDALGNAACSSATLLDVFLSSKYGASTGRMQRAFDEKQREQFRAVARSEKEIREYHLFYNLVRYLKQDSLIREEKRKGEKFLAITQKGMEKLKSLITRKESVLPPPTYSNKEGSSTMTIVMFDIPEKQRRRRAWLRAALRNIGCTLIQKSVWIGRVKIPREFLEDIKKLHLVEYVEIFEITKVGSLRHVL